MFDFAHGALAGSRSQVNGQDLIPSIGDGELMFAILAEVHFAEVELILVDGRAAARGGICGSPAALPGVLAEFKHGRTGPDAYAQCQGDEDRDEESLASHTYSLANLGGKGHRVPHGYFP